MLKGFKGFDENLKCKGFQYKVGGEYEEPEAVICNKGFHFCENPFDVFSYYPPSDSRYAEVEGDGETVKSDHDSKVVCTKLRVGQEIGLLGIISAGVKFILDRIDWSNNKQSNTGDWSTATNIGNWSAATNIGHGSTATNTGLQSVATNIGHRSAATNTGHGSAAINAGDWSTATNIGDWSVAANTGNWSTATNTGLQSVATNIGVESVATNIGFQSAATNIGHQSVAINIGHRSAAIVDGKGSVAASLGIKGKAKGSLGCWLVLAEWEGVTGEDYFRKDVKCVQVDGEIVKANTFYRLENGEFVECEEVR